MWPLFLNEQMDEDSNPDGLCNEGSTQARVEGFVMIRVTEALKPFTDFSMIRPDVLDYASERGTVIHHACSLHARGAFVLCELWPPDYVGYFYSFRDWFDNYVEKVVAIEIELINGEFGFIGHPDLLCNIQGDWRPTLVDLKTPLAESPTWKPQLAAYRNLAIKAGYDIGRVGSLRLKPDGGRAIFTEYTDEKADFAAFLNALMIAKYFKGGE